ncbi:MAG: phosphoribosylglycinamide formyltransferase [Deltaproteobacteria bacterium]|nr:phosphoribosylglycinamide formyltransferase [Deltaproteobacteria bacterium]
MGAPRETSRLAVFASGSGSNFGAVVAACREGRLPAEVALCVCDRARAGVLERARAAAVPSVVVTPRSYPDREALDHALAGFVRAVRAELVVLAGWMRILGPAFLDAFPGRVLNLHPALPGELPGVNAIARAWREGQAGARTRTGVMVHHAVPEVDAGPVIRQEEVALVAGEPLEALEARVHAVEHRLLVAAIGDVLSGRGK